MIADLSESEVSTYCHCLEDWSREFDDAGDRKERWYRAGLERGLRVKVAKDEAGRLVGMIQYAPVEMAPVTGGAGSYYVFCIWVHGHKLGVGNQQKKGYGAALLGAAEEDVRRLGGAGLAAWGLMIPVFMRSSWFKKRGYARADRIGMAELVWKKFAEGAEPPRMLRPVGAAAPSLGGKAGASGEKATATDKKTVVTCYANGWCSAQNIVYERAKRAAAELGEGVAFVGIDTSSKEKLLEHGISDALYINKKLVRTGPPPSYEKIRKLVAKARARS